jgi:hypothetical protein
MKTKILFIAFLLAAFAYGATAQSLQKGNLVGTHTMKLTLKPGVSEKQFIDFFNLKYKPAFVKAIPDWQIFLVKSIRGEVPKDTYGLIFVIKSAHDRDKFYNPDGTDSNFGKAVSEKLKPLFEEFDKICTYETVYTDWEVL